MVCIQHEKRETVCSSDNAARADRSLFRHRAVRLKSQGSGLRRKRRQSCLKRGRFSITERFLKAGLHGKRERESVPFPCPLSL
ncbi:hypothetical protein I33_3511 [Bacillus subtilis subsp. subtilis str. RO-NN-1]|nr:hypothetical protein I33_3511 [Bacillus subtilis subsp. subtilis str. RO-NN-1]